MDKVDVRPFLDFVDDHARPGEISAILEEVLWDYACGKIEEAQSGAITVHINQNISVLRGLVGVFKEM